MIAAQVFLGLWATGLSVAAPQLDFGGPRSDGLDIYQSNISQDQVVSDVVTALQPSIEAAIAEALASLSATSVSSSPYSENKSGFSSGLSSTGGAAGVVREPAQYNYEYKVADEVAQNYISKSESRDGDSLTGQYSYVDPNGDLVTVNYEAGPMGFSAVTEKQAGFVTIRAQSPGSSTNSGFSGSSSSGFSETSLSGSTGFSGASKSSTVDQSALIAQIIASLQPQISSAVQTALASSSSRNTNSFNRAGGARARDLSGTFGNGVSVSIDTPEYQINY